MALIMWIERNVKSRINSKNNIKPVQLLRELYRKYGIQVNYNKMWSEAQMMTLIAWCQPYAVLLWYEILEVSLVIVLSNLSIGSKEFL